MSEDRVYLVAVIVHLLSGHDVTAVDAIEAPSAVVASNTAYNMFLRAEGQAIVFGEQAFFPEAVASFRAKVLGLVDISDVENKEWKRSVEVSREYFKDE